MLEVNGGFRQPKTKVVIIAASVAFVLVSGAAGFFAWQFFTLKNDPGQEDKETASRISDAVSEIYMVPKETPAVAQIQDKEKLKDQPFFAAAENGDYILIFRETKLALVYREKDHKIVTAGPVDLGTQGSQQPQLQGAATQP